LHLSREQDACYFRYDGGGDGKLLLHNDGDFRTEAKNAEFTADADFSVKSGATLEINGGSGVAVKGAKVDLSPGGTVTIAPGGAVTITASSVVINGVNFSTHTHAWLATPAPGSPGVTLGPNVTGG
jgi:hypothetical protein